MKQRPSFLRDTGKWTDIFPIAGVLSFLLSILGTIVSLLLFLAAHFEEILTSWTGDQDIASFLIQYSSFLGIWIVFIIFLSFKGNRPMLKAFLYRRDGNNIKGALLGFALGFITNGFCVLMSVLLGDIKLSYNAFQPGIFFAFLLAVTIQSGAEEITDRCYLYQKLRRRYKHPAVAIIGNALVFAAMHLANDGITVISIMQIAIIGVVFSLFVYYFNCLWAAIMMHAGWNFTQSIVFGLPNSGIVSKYSLFTLEAASARNGLFYNVNFGVEGSAGAVALLAAVMVILIITCRKKDERLDVWAQEQETMSGNAS